MKQFCVILVILTLLNICISEEENLHPPCSSQIYCHGRLLHTIQMAKIFEDSKTFVDMKLRKPEDETLKIFDDFMKRHNKPDKFQLNKFVLDNFEEAGTEFEAWEPSDWKKHPNFLNPINDEKARNWASEIHHIWNGLGRKFKKEVELNQELHSTIWVPHPLIVPGGRFREFYYWDSYWIIQGLLISEMHDTAKGMLENFLDIVDRYGHIPNGGRIYYLARSQPPLLIPMIKLYYEYTHDLTFIEKYIGLMEKEFMFWLDNHTVKVSIDGTVYTLAIFGDQSSGPRPESYSEDVESAAAAGMDDNQKEAYYSELKAGAESGWDFSSRWFITNGTNKGNLTSTKTRSIAPVDLNAILYGNAKQLSEFHAALGDEKKSEHYAKIANEFYSAVQSVLWHEEIGAWLDYDISNNAKRDYFYPSNISPLWTGCYNQSKNNEIAHTVMKYLQSKNVMFVGGVPSTLEHTGEQWDYPNAWAPLQHMMIVGLNNTGVCAAKEMARQMAFRWLRGNYKGYTEKKALYEKYDATVPGGHGGGGEYEVQEGFGWTNGVDIFLLWSYRDEFTLEEISGPPVAEEKRLSVSSTTLSSASTVLIVLLISLTAGFIGHKYNTISLRKTNSKVHIEYTKAIKRKMTDTSESNIYSQG